jgi:hypothetical protein
MQVFIYLYIPLRETATEDYADYTERRDEGLHTAGYGHDLRRNFHYGY